MCGTRSPIAISSHLRIWPKIDETITICKIWSQVFSPCKKYRAHQSLGPYLENILDAEVIRNKIHIFLTSILLTCNSEHVVLQTNSASTTVDSSSLSKLSMGPYLENILDAAASAWTQLPLANDYLLAFDCRNLLAFKRNHTTLPKLPDSSKVTRFLAQITRLLDKPWAM